MKILVSRKKSSRAGWPTWLTCAVALTSSVGISGQETRIQQPTRDTGVALATGTGVITGQIVLDDGRPLRQVTVNLSGGQLRGSRMTVTDDAGRFLFTDLPAGQFSLSASKPAHISLTYNPAAAGGRSEGPPLQLAAGQRIAISLRMARGAVISGRILDDYGRPLSGVRLQAMQYRMQGGQRTMVSSRGAQLPTDDRGMYRIYGLPAGEYVVSATSSGNSNAPVVTQAEIEWARALATATAATSPTATRPPVSTPPPPGPPIGFAPVYFPGTAEASRAMVLTLTEGEERTGVDFSMHSVALSKVEGVVLDPSGQPAQSIQVMLTPTTSTEMGPQGVNVSTRIDRDGKFSVMNVPPGQYTLVVRSSVRPPAPAPPGGQTFMPPPQQQGPSLWAMTEVSVSGQDIAGIALTLAPGLKVSGQVVFDAAGAPPTDLSRARIQLSPAQSTPFGGQTQTTTTPEGRFIVSGVMPGRYRINGNVQPAPGQAGGWMLKSATLEGRDVLETPIDITRDDLSGLVVTFTDRVTELTGTLLSGAGQPAPGVHVLLFSTNRAHWVQGSRRVRSIRSGADGKFRFGSLVPGEYYMITMADLSAVDWTDPVFLEQLAAASFKIPIAEGEKKVQDLKMAK